MDKKEQLRDLTRGFIAKVSSNKNFDAASDLKEMIAVAKEVRYDRISADIEI